MTNLHECYKAELGFWHTTYCTAEPDFSRKVPNGLYWPFANKFGFLICGPHEAQICSGEVGWLCWGLTSQSTIFQSCRDGAIASWVINQYFRGVKCLAQGHNTAAVGLEPRTSRSGVRHSTTEPPRSPQWRGTVWLKGSIPYWLTMLVNALWGDKDQNSVYCLSLILLS